ncbi:MAG: hypothetical protein KGL11_13970 [Alphaproteobacteria bacterium]|nr:hypothetical protein [Alphaproteobacteria bacterium]
MTRVVLTILLPLLAPTAIYFLWLFAFGRAEDRRAPWTWLLVGGLAAAALALVIVGVGSGGPRSGRYVPPHVEDGRLVPGQIVPQGAH